MAPAASSRWCPTPEQLMILEEMYRGGIRTPNATQIQQITAHLTFYGKIEGKNVFYWFQNHKARDRQKLRRKLMLQNQILQRHNNQQNYHLFNYLDSHALHHFSHYNSTPFLQEGGAEDAPIQLMTYTWNMDLPERFETDKSMIKPCSRDWMMMMTDVGPTSTPCSNKKPLKTLDLFPTTPG